MRWNGSRPDRLTRLARAIDALGETDRKLIAESTKVDRLRLRGALDLYRVCSGFVEKVNDKLSDAAVLLDPPSYSEGNYNDTGLNLFQINLRGRILQVEFGATAELYESDDFRLPYILRGAVRSFNQDLLERSSIDEHLIFYCPKNDAAVWHFVDSRTYRSGRITENYLISEMERLL
ncbi:MAG TPA: hypothetical protein VHY84_15750 [Bryobacteraceae bacterium]|nr:hypothetical protein [Bryobacteraceae bacterium]